MLEAGFGRPSGLLGRVGGWLMARGNAVTERHLVQLADLHPEDVVLVLGPGPGIGLHAAGTRSGHVIGIDPSPVMREAARRRCAELISQGRVRVESGVAADSGRPDGAVDVVLAVNNVQIWPDRRAGLAELRRVLRPGGRMLLSAHQKWLPGGQAALTAAVQEAGFGEVQGLDLGPARPGRNDRCTTGCSPAGRLAPFCAAGWTQQEPGPPA